MTWILAYRREHNEVVLLPGYYAPFLMQSIEKQAELRGCIVIFKQGVRGGGFVCNLRISPC